MGLKRHLDDFEKRQIIALDFEKLSLGDISDIEQRDPSTIQRFLKRRTKKVPSESARNNTKLTAVINKRLLRAASNSFMRARK